VISHTKNHIIATPRADFFDAGGAELKGVVTTQSSMHTTFISHLSQRMAPVNVTMTHCNTFEQWNVQHDETHARASHLTHT
jgi:hypothetical protein